MSEWQNVLMRYLISIEAPMDYTLFIVGSLWKEEQLMEMFKYILEHQEANYRELYLVACRIAKEIEDNGNG